MEHTRIWHGRFVGEWVGGMERMQQGGACARDTTRASVALELWQCRRKTARLHAGRGWYAVMGCRWGGGSLGKGRTVSTRKSVSSRTSCDVPAAKTHTAAAAATCALAEGAGHPQLHRTTRAHGAIAAPRLTPPPHPHAHPSPRTNQARRQHPGSLLHHGVHQVHEAADVVVPHAQQQHGGGVEARQVQR